MKDIPYGQKYWQKLNLDDCFHLADLILAECACSLVHVRACLRAHMLYRPSTCKAVSALNRSMASDESCVRGPKYLDIDSRTICDPAVASLRRDV